MIMKFTNIIKKMVPDQKTQKLKTESFPVAWPNYYAANIKKLARMNPEWKSPQYTGKKIFRYTYVNKPVELVPEFNNIIDKNAVAVYIAGEKVGYISADECVHVSQILKHADIKYITAFVGGGQYKVINETGDTFKDEYGIYINVRIAYTW